jgi:hypothetical protein
MGPEGQGLRVEDKKEAEKSIKSNCDELQSSAPNGDSQNVDAKGESKETVVSAPEEEEFKEGGYGW